MASYLVSIFLLKRQMSVVHIEHGETTERGKPKVAGLSDPRLGTIDRKMKCETCMANIAECAGHFGHLELAKPMFHIVSGCTAGGSQIQASPKNRPKKILDACKSKTKCDGGDEIDSQNQDTDEPVKKSRGGCGAQQPKKRLYKYFEYKIFTNIYLYYILTYLNHRDHLCIFSKPKGPQVNILIV